MQMDGIIEVFIVVAIYDFETVLKNFGKWRHKGPPFRTFHQALCRDFVILLFWNKYSSFVPILIMTGWKFGPI